MRNSLILRTATSADVPALTDLIHLSVRTLQVNDYTPAQLESALRVVYGVDTRLIHDGTYYAVTPQESPDRIVACGGWSRFRTLYGGDNFAGRQDLLLDPATDAAKIRAFFVHPDYTRRGIGSLILDHCEHAARAAGFTRLEMGSTLTGVALYAARGYATAEHLEVPLENGLTLPIVRMHKTVC